MQNLAQFQMSSNFG